MLESEKETRRIVFFDGICHLCNGFIDFAIQNEKAAKKSLFFAPLQGSTASKLLEEKDRIDLQTVVYWDGQILHRESEAVLRILSQLAFPWNWISIFGKWLPVLLRNAIYHWVAQHRYQWFGQRDSCRLPQALEKSQLLP